VRLILSIAEGQASWRKAPTPSTTYILTATNSAGSVTAQTTVTVTSGTPGGITLTATPTLGAAPLSVTFTAGTNCPPLVPPTLSFGDGTSQVVYCGSTDTHTYTAAETYTATLSISAGVLSTVTVTVTSCGGGTSAVTCASSDAGLMEIGSDALWYSPNSGLTVQFMTTTQGGWVPGISIDFEDNGTPLSDAGFPITSCNAARQFFMTWTHTYPAPGTYTLSQIYNGQTEPLGQITVTSPTASAQTSNANLANALTALESALQAFLGAH